MPPVCDHAMAFFRMQRRLIVKPFAALGVLAGDGRRFADAWKSFGMRAKLQQADQLGRTLRVQAVPSLVISGRRLTSVSLAGSHERALRVVEELIFRTRGEQGRGCTAGMHSRSAGAAHRL